MGRRGRTLLLVPVLAAGLLLPVLSGSATAAPPANADHVVVFWIWRGHQAGTGRPLVLHTSDLYQVADGLLVEHWNTVDFTALEPFGIARP